MADWLSALGSVGAAVFAIMIYLEARRIRRGEWANQQNSIWNDFHKCALEYGEGSKIYDIMNGRAVVTSVSDRDVHLFLIFMNSMNSVYNSVRLGVIDMDYAAKSIFDMGIMLAPNRAWITPLLRKRGFEENFVALLDALMSDTTSQVEARVVLRKQLNALRRRTLMRLLAPGRSSTVAPLAKADPQLDAPHSEGTGEEPIRINAREKT